MAAHSKSDKTGTTPDGDQMLTRKEAAAFFKVSEKTMSRLPIHILDLGYRTKRYRLRDLLAFVEKRAP